MKYFLFLFLIASHAYAADDGGAIDLGELKINGDIRRPSTNFYQLKSMHDSQLAEISELTFNDFENQLLEAKKEKPHGQ